MDKLYTLQAHSFKTSKATKIIYVVRMFEKTIVRTRPQYNIRFLLKERKISRLLDFFYTFYYNNYCEYRKMISL